MEDATDVAVTDGPGVNKKLMRLSVDARTSTKRSSLLFDNTTPVPSQTEVFLRDEDDESPSGNIRISRFLYSESRFPRMEEMSHFHYSNVHFPAPVTVSVCDQYSPDSSNGDHVFFMIQVVSQGKLWVVKRTYVDIVGLDRQIHRCVYDRGYSQLGLLPNVAGVENSLEDMMEALGVYMRRLTEILGNNVSCGPVLNWFELDNHGNHLVVMEADDSAINVPAVAAAKVIKRYIAQAPDEISLEVNDFISVIDMPPCTETIWWRGKKALEVGFFPCHCVEILHHKDFTESVVPRSFSLVQKPVTKKRGKFISFLRNFFRSRPSKDELMQTGILRERVFGADLGEHLTNTQRDIPLVLDMCSQVIEEFGIVDGIYRLSGITSNMQKLRVAFDNEEPPNLTEPKYLNDIHCISSLLKTYFRELPNPLLTYELYDRFVLAMSKEDNTQRTVAFHHAIQRLPPPHYRTLEYLLRHLSRVASYSSETNMNEKNLAIVWSPNLLKPNVEEYGQRILSEIRVQAVIIEYLLKNVDVFFDKNIASAAIAYYPETENGDQTQHIDNFQDSQPPALPSGFQILSSPPKLISLEEARARIKENGRETNNGITLDTVDGAPDSHRHKVKAPTSPPRLASFPVSEGPSLLTLEEAQARSRLRSAKIPRRGSVDLLEYRTRLDKETPLLPASPSPKKRGWRGLFSRTKSSNEYNEATLTMPKTSSLSYYRRRNESRSSSLQSRSFSSYSLGDYVRTGGGGIFDNIASSLSNKSKRIEISEPIPQRTESFISYVGGDMLFDSKKASNGQKPERKVSLKTRSQGEESNKDRGGIPTVAEDIEQLNIKRTFKTVQNSDAANSPPVRKPSATFEIGAPAVNPSLPKAALPSTKTDEVTTSSSFAPVSAEARTPEDVKSQAVWIRGPAKPKSYQVELIRHGSTKVAESEPRKTLKLNDSPTMLSHSETDPDISGVATRMARHELYTKSGQRQRMSPGKAALPEQEVNQSPNRKSQRPPVFRSLSEAGSNVNHEDLVSNRKARFSTDYGCARAAREEMKIELSSPPIDKLVERTALKTASDSSPDVPDAMSPYSKPSTAIVVSSSELQQIQTAILPPALPDGLVTKTIDQLSQRNRLLSASPVKNHQKRHSTGGIREHYSSFSSSDRHLHGATSLTSWSTLQRNANAVPSKGQTPLVSDGTRNQKRFDEYEQRTSLSVGQNTSKFSLKEDKTASVGTPETLSTDVSSMPSASTVEDDVFENKREGEKSALNVQLSGDGKENLKSISNSSINKLVSSEVPSESSSNLKSPSLLLQKPRDSLDTLGRRRQRPLSEVASTSPMRRNTTTARVLSDNCLYERSGSQYEMSPRRLTSDLHLNKRVSDGLVNSTFKRSQISYHEEKGDEITDVTGSSRPSGSTVKQEARRMGLSSSDLAEFGSHEIRTLQDNVERSRMIRQNLMTRGSRELKSQSLSRGTRNKVQDEKQFFCKKESMITTERQQKPVIVNIEYKADNKVIDSLVTTIGPQLTDSFSDVEHKRINVLKTDDCAVLEEPTFFDWVPVMQKSLLLAIPSDACEALTETAAAADTSVTREQSLQHPTSIRRPSTYDNVELRRTSLYDNLKCDDV